TSVNALASSRRDNLVVSRSIWLALYGIAFVLLCNIALARSAGTGHAINGSLADPIYVTLVILTLIAAILFVAQPVLPWSEESSVRLEWTALAASFVAALALAALLWSFDLDDKWAYYRTSKYLLIEGVPNYNLGEWLNVNTSFVWPYLMAPGHFF